MRTVSGGATATPSMTPARSGRWNAGPAPSFTSRSSMRGAAHPVAMRALEREFFEPVVRVEAAHGRHTMPRAVGTKLPRQDIVGERDVEDLLQALAKLRISDWNHSLDAPVEVARHEV